ncbi:MAG: class I SAM-dependent methyltransferase [Opitutales bacterium]|nr:class I SAM-dependent methyltransferase [Opitutales bacterium]
MIFRPSKVSAKDVLGYYAEPLVLQHYEDATEKVGLWNSEEMILKRVFNNQDSKLLELGCGTGRISFGLYKLGYRKLKATDFSKKMIRAAKVFNQKFKTAVEFQTQDATALNFEDKSFDGVIFGFNGLMQIPGLDNRRKAIAESFRVLRQGGYFIFTAHDRTLPKWKKFWIAERKKWNTGKQDPNLLEFGDRFEETPKGKLFIHVPHVTELRSDLQAAGFVVERDVLRSKLVDESPLTLKYSDECRFWICRKPL